MNDRRTLGTIREQVQRPMPLLALPGLLSGPMAIRAVVYAITAFVFYFDVTTDSPLAAGVLYVPLVLTSSQFNRRNWTWIFSGIACLLTALGILIPDLHFTLIGLANRSLSIGTILLTAAFVTAQQRTHERLAAATARAGDAELAKSQLMQKAGHEFRNSLNAVLGFTQLLKLDCQPEQKEAIQAIEQGGQRLVETVENLIDLTDMEERGPCLRRLNLAALLQEAATRVQTAADERDVIVVWDPPHDRVPDVFGDDWAVRRILDNLFRNAVKFSPAGGRVRIRLLNQRDNATIEIADSGRGMRPELLERLGDPLLGPAGFAGRDADGLGIGLALSLKLASLTQGKLNIASEYGRGTTASFSLPFPP